MDVLDFQELKDLDGALPCGVEPCESDIFSMFLSDEMQHSECSSPPSMPSDSPASSPNSCSYEDSSLFDNEGLSEMAPFDFFGEDESTSNMDVKQEPCSSSDSEDSEEVKPRRTNKRNLTAMEASVTLTREELRNMSSKGLEEYAAQLAATRQLTKGEERALKRQRRLIKNRESAQLSRARKKMYIEELERKVNTVSVHSEHMAAQMAHLAAENKALKDEVYMLRNALKQQQQQQPQQPQPQQQMLQTDSHPNDCHSKQMEESFTPLSMDSLPGILSSKRLSQNARNAGLCLFVVLLSFGILFSATTLPQGPALPTIAKREPIPSVFPTGYTGRTLKAVEVSADVESSNAALRDTHRSHGEEVGSKLSPLAAPVDERGSGVVVMNSPPSVLCSEAYKLDTSESSGEWNGQRPTFTLVLPPAALEGAVPNVDKIANGQLLEVGCQILSLSVVPSTSELPMLTDGEPERIILPASQPVAAGV